MKSENSLKSVHRSSLNYNYQTIKITKSRIDKGLIAIPRTLLGWFPEHNQDIKIFLDDFDEPQMKVYTSYKSKTRESRIGGLKEWINKGQFTDGDEIVIQCLDKERHIYHLSSEKLFVNYVQGLQKKFDSAENEETANDKIIKLSTFVDLTTKKTAINEYHRLSNLPLEDKRKYVTRKSNKTKEQIPYNLRIIVGEIYKGICQVCGFYFLKKNKMSYFEIHHLDALKGNHPKNLVLVCANCHRQFEYANVFHGFSEQGWLVSVRFNRKNFQIKQNVGKKPEEFIKQIHLS
jgi:hypothetical protein